MMVSGDDRHLTAFMSNNNSFSSMSPRWRWINDLRSLEILHKAAKVATTLTDGSLKASELAYLCQQSRHWIYLCPAAENSPSRQRSRGGGALRARRGCPGFLAVRKITLCRDDFTSCLKITLQFMLKLWGNLPDVLTWSCAQVTFWEDSATFKEKIKLVPDQMAKQMSESVIVWSVWGSNLQSAPAKMGEISYLHVGRH